MEPRPTLDELEFFWQCLQSARRDGTVATVEKSQTDFIAFTRERRPLIAEMLQFVFERVKDETNKD